MTSTSNNSQTNHGIEESKASMSMYSSNRSPFQDGQDDVLSLIHRFRHPGYDSIDNKNNNNNDDDDDDLVSADEPLKKQIPPPLASTEHLGGSRQYWRDIILGVNDGLVSTFLLVAGVAGGGLSSEDILLTAIAGSLAGAVSMATGEYVATKSQNEVMEGELTLERQHVERYPEDEIQELGNLLPLIGLIDEGEEDDAQDNKDEQAEKGKQNDNLRQQILLFYRQHPKALLKIMTVLEFGVIDEEVRSPILAGLFSCGLFFMGSLPSLVPFIFSGDEPMMGLVLAALLTTAALAIVGAVKTWATRGNCYSAAAENLVIAGMGGVLAYATGLLFDHLVHHRHDGDGVDA